MDTPSARLGVRATLLVVGYAALLLLPWLGGGIRVLTKHEVLYAEPAREMLAGGSWIVPDFAGEKRVNKPPTLSWFIAASMAVFGKRSEWAIRLPSALAGVALAWLAAVLAARWCGPRVGLWAGLLQATTWYQLMQARLAETDMPLAACVAAAMLCFALGALEPAPPRRRRVLACGFWLAAGVSFLLKGVGPLFLLVALACFALAARDRHPLRFLLDPLGIALFVAALVAWPLAAWAEHPQILDAWRRQTLGRVLGELPNGNPPYYYLYAVPLLLLPWLPFAAGGVRALREAGEPGRRRLLFLACWLLPGLFLLSLSAFRSAHYAIPLLLPATVLAAAGFERSLRRPASGRRAFLLSAGALAAGVGAGLWAVARWRPGLFREAAAVLGVLALGLLLTFAARRRGRRRLACGLLFGTLALAVAGVSTLLLPRLDDYRDWTQLAVRTNARRAEGETVHLVRLGQTQVAFYLDPPALRWDGIEELEVAGAAGRGPFLILAPRRVADRLAGQGRVELLDRAQELRRHETEDERLTLFRWHPD